MARTGRLKAQTLAQSALCGTTCDAMWRLYSAYYTDTSRAQFDRDLAQKHSVIVLCDSGDGSLQGFSTIEVVAQPHDGVTAIAVFSGDTIVERDYWGQSALHRAFFRFLLAIKLQNLGQPVYWYLISKGYKTYLLLARNFVNYWPRHNTPTPAREQAMLESISQKKYPNAWRPDLGVLRFAVCEGRLKAGIAPVDTELLADPSVRFFVEKNPGHAKGDELCCLGKVDLALVAFFVTKHLLRLLPFIDTKKKAWAQATS